MPSTGVQSSPDSSALSLKDALRLAFADERFAKAILVYPEEFRDSFNLSSKEIEALKRAGRIEPTADALAKVQELLTQNVSTQPAETGPLDLNDLLRLAAADEKLAYALLANPDDFREAFSLTDAEVDAVKKASQIEPITKALDTIREIVSGTGSNSSPNDDLQLTIDDALRLSKVDSRFACALTASTSDFKTAFNLGDADVATLEKALGNTAV